MRNNDRASELLKILSETETINEVVSKAIMSPTGYSTRDGMVPIEQDEVVSYSIPVYQKKERKNALRELRGLVGSVEDLKLIAQIEKAIPVYKREFRRDMREKIETGVGIGIMGLIIAGMAGGIIYSIVKNIEN